jgi:hypothetical protein
MDNYGRWLPPRRIYGSEIRAGGTTGNFYYFDGTRVSQVNALPNNVIHYKSTSIYHDADLLWMIPYDATVYRVGMHALFLILPFTTSYLSEYRYQCGCSSVKTEPKWL